MTLRILNNTIIFILVLFLILQHSHAETPSPESKQKLLVSIIDTGIDLNNKELKKYLWTNPGETGLDENQQDKASNGKDDDRNGFIDDIHGWNFVKNNTDIQDTHGHGTHIASLIIDSLKQSHKDHLVELQILKYFHTENDTHDILQASNKSFAYAQTFQPRIINYSGGGYTASLQEKRILSQFTNSQTLIIAAAGNDSHSNDHTPYYPASYQFPFIISIGSIDKHNQPSAFSNYGKHSVDFFSLGEKIAGKTVGNITKKLSGTSQATAKVTGIIIYLLTETLQPTNEFIYQFLCEQTKSTEKISQISECGKYVLTEDILKFKGKTRSLFEN